MRNQLHNGLIGISSPNRLTTDLAEEERNAFITGSLFDDSILSVEYPTSIMLLSDNSVLNDADSRDDNGVDGFHFSRFVDQNMFATPEHSTESFGYAVATPTNTTSDDTFSRHLILTPRSPTSDSFRDLQNQNRNPFAIYDNGSAIYNSVEADLQGQIPRSNDLVGLSSIVPQILPNPYSPGLLDGLDNFNFNQIFNNDAPTTEHFTRETQVSGPWNPELAHNNRYQGPGNSTFLPPQGPMASYENIQNNARPEKRKPSTQEIPAKRRNKRKGKGPACDEREERETQWEHSFCDPVSESLQTRKEGKGGGKGPKRGVRVGPMTLEGRLNANGVRQGSGSCWHCGPRKTRCSADGICGPCMTYASKNNLVPCCYRMELTEFRDLFFRDEMIAHFRADKITKLVSDNIVKFTDEVFEVEVTVGQVFKPMRLEVCRFIPKTEDLMQHHQIRLQTDGLNAQKWQLFRNGAAPVGFEPGIDIEDLKNKCSTYIDSMIHSPHYSTQTTTPQPTPLPHHLLSLLQTHYLSLPPTSTPTLLYLALKLHATTYFMSRIITFTPSSTLKILEILKLPIPADTDFELDDYDNFSSRLLGRQLKFAVHLLHKELNGNVLKKLHNLMRGSSRGESAYGECFGAIVLLALCGEEQQLAVSDWVSFRLGGGLRELGFEEEEWRVEWRVRRERERELECNRRLDEVVGVFGKLFCDVFGVGKRGVGVGEGGLVGRVRRGLDRKEMEKLQAPIFNTDVETYINSRIDLAERNPGRLASSFLLSLAS